jgi:hypothetical protein
MTPTHAPPTPDGTTQPNRLAGKPSRRSLLDRNMPNLTIVVFLDADSGRGRPTGSRRGRRQVLMS